jgi:hypothetical protein
MRYLFLDDIRMPGDVTWLLIGGVGSWGADWEIVRSYNEAVAWVRTNGFPDVISFDHDLGYEEYDTTESGMVMVTNAKEEKSGHDFAKWLVEYDMDTKTMPSDFRYTIHSINPSGTKNIRGTLEGYLNFRRLS